MRALSYSPGREPASGSECVVAAAGFTVVLATVAGTVFGGYALSRGGPRSWWVAVAAPTVMGVSLLAFAATLPDITDNEADIAGISTLCHLVAVAAFIVAGIVAVCREVPPARSGRRHFALGNHGRGRCVQVSCGEHYRFHRCAVARG